ncbi:TonB-dependent receptor [Novosphingobium capsulatum]|uniref:TonB-dependent receptor n=2 Tax=Novosphingobium capsulatum TaxID=13688 RepID=UPI000A0071CD|nr:TonB-dependent receptor [Novosphingobium capsulatum]WQD91454.1 TonB-dependent receptor [Novosphingobium capsulatum]
MRHVWIFAGCSALALASPSYAQSAMAASVPRQDDGGAPAIQPAANAGEIIVTANRRAERLQQVPIAVTVVDGAQLARQNVNTVENLTRSAPALEVAGPTGYGALSIRGVGGISLAQSSEGSVGVVVDNVALANTSIDPPLLFDIARIEVLEGPQSTLFGRNSSAGVINIVTAAPDPSRTAVIAHADIGTRDNYIGRLAVNLPVSDNAALRIAGGLTQDPKVQYNRADDSWQKRKSEAVRGRFLWEASDKLTINLSGDYTHNHYDGGVQWAVFQSSPTSLLTARLNACGVTVGPSNTDGCAGPNRSNHTVFGFSGQIDLALGGYTLTSVSAIRRRTINELVDIDSTTADRYIQPQSGSQRNLSQELRLSTPNGGRVEGVAGLYYSSQRLTNSLTQVGNILADLPLIGACPLPLASLCALPFGQTRDTAVQTEGYAAFGQATVHISPRLRVLLGLRVGHESVKAQTGATTLAPGAVAQLTPLPGINARVSDTYVGYRVGVQYEVAKQVMVFATVTRGYKGPAVNDQAAGVSGSQLIVRPEIPTAFEGGFKSSLMNGRIAFNATGFYTRIKDFQASFVDTSTPANLLVFGNVPTYRTWGASANLFGRPVQGLTVNIGATFLVRRYGAGYLAPNALGQVVDVSTFRPGGSLKLTSSLEYTAPLTARLNGFFQADVVRNPRLFSNAAGDSVLAVDSWVNVGGRLGVKSADNRLGVSVFVRNLFDTIRSGARFVTPTAAQQLDPVSYSQFAGAESRRVVGLSLDASF